MKMPSDNSQPAIAEDLLSETRAQDLRSPLADEERKGLRWSSNNMMVFVPFEPPKEEEIERIEEIFAVAA